MCTIIIAKGLVSGYPLVVGHNRDELIDRWWLPPARWPERPGLLAPRDLQAGGTWLAVNDDGLVVAISNRHGGRTVEHRASRGMLTLQASDAPSVEAARARVHAHLAAERYHGFNLVLADAHDAVVMSREDPERGRQAVVEETVLGDGLHIVTSLHHLDSPADDELRRPLLDAAAHGPTAFGTALRRVLSSSRRLSSGYQVCKHRGGFGTVCGAILWMATTGLVRYEFAPGPPDSTPFADVPLADRQPVGA